MGFQKKMKSGVGSVWGEGRGVGSLGYWQTKRADKLSTRAKKPGGKGQRRQRIVGGAGGVRNLCGLPDDGVDGGKTFALNLSGPNNFGFFVSIFFVSFFLYTPLVTLPPTPIPPTFFVVSVFIRRRGGRTKQKDFAAKAYGFLVSCYYFIWPQSELESESAFASTSQSSPGLAAAPAPARTCNFCSEVRLATDNCKRGA